MSGVTPVGSSDNGVTFADQPNGLYVTVASNTTLGIAVGNCPDSTNVTNMNLTSPLVVNSAITGANGVEAGTTFSASTQYYLHLISSSMNDPLYPTAGLISTSKTAPVKPQGYDTFRFISYERTDSSVHFLARKITGNGSNRKLLYNAVIAATVASSGSSQSLALIDLSAAVPPVDGVGVHLDVAFTPATAGHTTKIAPGISTATALPIITGQVASVLINKYIYQTSNLVAGVPSVQYINSNAAGLTAANVQGFDFTL